MESHHQQTNMCKIFEVTVKDLPKINELENQLNLNKTKLNFFNQTLSNENFKFIKLVLEKQIIGFLQFSLNKSDCDIISIGVTPKFQKTFSVGHIKHACTGREIKTACIKNSKSHSTHSQGCHEL